MGIEDGEWRILKNTKQEDKIIKLLFEMTLLEWVDSLKGRIFNKVLGKN